MTVKIYSRWSPEEIELLMSTWNRLKGETGLGKKLSSIVSEQFGKNRTPRACLSLVQRTIRKSAVEKTSIRQLHPEELLWLAEAVKNKKQTGKSYVALEKELGVSARILRRISNPEVLQRRLDKLKELEKIVIKGAIKRWFV